MLAEARTQTVDLSGSVFGTLDATAAEISGSFILNRCRAQAIISSLAHVSGRLLLDSAHLTNPRRDALLGEQMTVDGGMFCRRFHSEGEVRLLAARVSGQLALNGAHLVNPGKNTLSADRMAVDGGVHCDEGFHSEGEIRLLAARISGQLSMRAAHLANPGNIVLNADQMTVDGDMFCDDGFHSEGEIRLLGAHIGGTLGLNSAHLANPGNNTLSGDDATVDGGMFCDDGFHSEGEIRLLGAHIGGELSLKGARLTNPGNNTLNADQMTVDSGMFCDDGFRSEGEIILQAAHIGGQLSLDSAHLANAGHDVLSADRITVDSDMLYREGFSTEGCVRLRGAHVGGQLIFRDATLSNPGDLALRCDMIQVDSLRLDGMTVAGTVDLRFAQVQVLYDDPSRWPGRILLDGFIYDDLQPYVSARGPSGRIAWLARAEGGNRAQPYEQLAAHYRRLGHDDEARWVLVGKQRRRRDELSVFAKIIGCAFDALVGYGYRPSRAFACLLVLIAAGSVYFTIYRPAALDPTQHPHYQPILYAADLVIPIVNFGQADIWAPAGASQWVAAIMTALGWIFATAAVAGITRVLTRTLRAAVYSRTHRVDGHVRAKFPALP